jgi:aarF domain-containing kinase
MLLLDNFVHSDLHPGNIMIKFSKSTSGDIYKGIISSIFHTTPPEDPAHNTRIDTIVDNLRKYINSPIEWREHLEELHDQGYTPEVVFLDAGLVTVLNDENRRNFLDLFRAIAMFDGYRAGKLMVERCRAPDLAIDTEVFALKMQHLVLNVKRKTFSLGQIKISDVLKDVLRNVREHHVKMEGDFVNTVISILLLEGIGRQLDPGLDLFKSALPILRQLGKQMAVEDTMANLPTSNLGALLKVR